VSRMDPLQRFLGLSPEERTPLALLNIRPEQCDEASIRAALSRRLDRVENHAEAGTPAADEARMALHAAAAQLLDPSVREAILSGAAPGAGEPEIPGAVRRTQVDALLSFRKTAIRTILLCRGWNRRSRRMLAAVAGASGLTPEQMAEALRSMTGPVVAPPIRNRPPTPPKQRTTILESFHEPAARGRGVPSSVILGIAGAVAAVAIVMIVIVRLLSPDAPMQELAVAPPEEDSGAPGIVIDEDVEPPVVEPRTGGLPDRRDDAPVSAQAPPDPAGLVRTLRRCVELAKDDPGQAAWRLEQAVSQLSGAWSLFEPRTLEAAQDAIVMFLRDAPAGGKRNARAMNAVSAGARRQGSAGRLEAHEILPAVWSCGMLAELVASPGVAAPVRDFALAGLDSAVGEFDPDGAGGFGEGALASLRAMNRSLATFDSGEGDERAWGRWREALGAATRMVDRGDTRREIETLLAAEAIMRHGPALARDPDAYAAAGALLGTVEWTPESAGAGATPARQALLRWFDDRTIETEDLALVTEWVVGESGAPGIGIQMTLHRDAGAEQRAALRDRYASVWGLNDDRGVDEVATRWRVLAERRLRRDADGGDEIGALARAAEDSRLSEAAARRWRREFSAARLILDDPYAVVEEAARQRGRRSALSEAGGDRDGAWALEYLSAGASGDRKFAAVSRLELWGGSIGPIDGDVLTRAALLGSPAEVRSAAQRVVRKRAEEPAVINGLLESIGVAPRNESTRALVESVTNRVMPSARSAGWEQSARLALTEKLLEMLAGRGGLSAIDRLSAALEQSHRNRAGESASAGDASRALWSAWRADAERFAVAPRHSWSLETIDRRRAGRVSLAVGPAQRFAAEQVSAAELMGYVVAAERPSRADEVEVVMRAMASARREASGVFGQIEATERAMLALWMIRLGETLPAGESDGTDGTEEAS